jgi:hypothetical protein
LIEVLCILCVASACVCQRSPLFLVLASTVGCLVRYGSSVLDAVNCVYCCFAAASVASETVPAGARRLQAVQSRQYNARRLRQYNSPNGRLQQQYSRGRRLQQYIKQQYNRQYSSVPARRLRQYSDPAGVPTCYSYGSFETARNERCEGLAARYNVTLADLQALNPLLDCSNPTLQGSMCVSATCPPG